MKICDELSPYFPGVIVKVMIKTDNDLSGKGISSIDMSIRVDSNFLTPLGASTIDTLSASWGEPIYNIKDDIITIALAGSNDLSGSGTLINLWYRVNPDVIISDSFPT